MTAVPWTGTWRWGRCFSDLDNGVRLLFPAKINRTPFSLAFFNLLNDETTTVNLRQGILRRRREWVIEQEAQRETDEYMEQIEAARLREIALKATHQFDQVKNFRHTQVAHNRV